MRSIMSWWTCAKAMQLRRSSPIVLRSHVFSLLKALNDLSASQEETGITKIILRTLSTSLKYWRVDVCMFRSTAATSSTDLRLQCSSCNKRTRDTTLPISMLLYRRITSKSASDDRFRRTSSSALYVTIPSESGLNLFSIPATAGISKQIGGNNFNLFRRTTAETGFTCFQWFRLHLVHVADCGKRTFFLFSGNGMVISARAVLISDKNNSCFSFQR